MSAYVGDGVNRWSAVHVLDAAPLYRLALEKGVAGATYHAIGEEGVPFRQIAEAIGGPEHSGEVCLAEAHFTWFAPLVGRDVPASSELTKKQPGWEPTGPGLIADLGQMQY